MLARVWYGKTREDQKESYLDVLNRTGVPSLKGTDGNRGVFVFRRERDGQAEFVVLSLWDSIEAVKRFAGPEPLKAVYFPEDDEFLLEKTPELDQFEVVVAPESLSGLRAGPPPVRSRW